MHAQRRSSGFSYYLHAVDIVPAPDVAAVLDLTAEPQDTTSALLGVQLGGIIANKFMSKYRVGIDLERSVLRLKNVS